MLRFIPNPNRAKHPAQFQPPPQITSSPGGPTQAPKKRNKQKPAPHSHTPSPHAPQPNRPDPTREKRNAPAATATATRTGATMEVASSSSSSSPSSAPPPSKPSFRLRLNPAAFLLRPVSPSPTPPPAAPPSPSSSSATPPKHPSTGGNTNPLTAFLSSILPITTPRTTTTNTRRSSSGSSPIAELRKAAAADAEAELQLAGCAVPLFRPYVARLPWHGGTRAWLSKLFPRYGHYCGPNWSSGKEAGSVLWDRRPADHLDFCCYCHDMAYDTHDQAQLLRADLAFLRCLQGSRTTPALDGAAAAAVYRSMCIFGLKVILIPYRTNLVRLQTGPNYGDVFADFVKRMASSSGRPTTGGGGEKQRL